MLGCTFDSCHKEMSGTFVRSNGMMYQEDKMPHGRFSEMTLQISWRPGIRRGVFPCEITSRRMEVEHAKGPAPMQWNGHYDAESEISQQKHLHLLT